jgi:hypothetical protein
MSRSSSKPEAALLLISEAALLLVLEAALLLISEAALHKCPCPGPGASRKLGAISLFRKDEVDMQQQRTGGHFILAPPPPRAL